MHNAQPTLENSLMASYKFLPYDAHILQMSMLLAKKNESTSQYFHTNIPSSFIHNSQNLEKKNSKYYQLIKE